MVMKRIFTYTGDFTKSLYLKCIKPSPRITEWDIPIRLNDVHNLKPIIDPQIIKIAQISVPFLNNSITVEYKTTYNSIIITKTLLTVTKFTIFSHLVYNGIYCWMSCDYSLVTHPAVITLSMVTGTITGLCSGKKGIMYDTNCEMKKFYEPPVVIIDDFSKKMPYTRELSTFGRHKHIGIILLDTPSKPRNITEHLNKMNKMHLKTFFSIYDTYSEFRGRELQFANLNIDSLTKEQSTRLIDRYIEKTFGFGDRVVLTSISRNVSDIYNLKGKHIVKSLKYLHIEKPIYEPDPNNDRIDLAKTMIRQSMNIDESSIDKKNSTIIYIDDFAFDTFDYSNICKRTVLDIADFMFDSFPSKTPFDSQCIPNDKTIEKIQEFDKHHVIVINSEHVNNGFYFPRTKLLENCGVVKRCSYHKMDFVNSSVHFSHNIDAIVKNYTDPNMVIGFGKDTNDIYLGFRNDKYQSLYNGKYPIVTLDVEKTRPNYSNIVPVNKKDFSEGIAYYIAQRDQKADRYDPAVFNSNERFWNQDWINGYIAGLMEDKRKSKVKMS